MLEDATENGYSAGVEKDETEQPERRHFARRSVTGEIEIVDRAFDFVRAVMPYDYRFTCNSQQWREAELICAALEGPMESLGVAVLSTSPQMEEG